MLLISLLLISISEYSDPSQDVLSEQTAGNVAMNLEAWLAMVSTAWCHAGTAHHRAGPDPPSPQLLPLVAALLRSLPGTAV